MECTCLDQLTFQAPGPETRSRNQKKLGDYREQRHMICNFQEDVLCGTVQCTPRAQRENPALMTISVPASQPEAGEGSQPRGEKEERGQEEVRRENKVLANHPVTCNFCYCKNGI